jgi:ectoine hydroxylase
MRLTATQLQRYHEEGYLFVENYFSVSEVDKVRSEALHLATQDMESIVREKNTGLVRALQGCHLFSPTFERLTRLSRILDPIQQIIGDATYVYQFKINFKMAFGGDIWKWHQDYIYWLKEDGMPQPSCANILIFLDDVGEFNGPLLFIPGSHRHGVIEPEPAGSKGDWKQSFGADLKYSLGKEIIAKLVNESTIVAPKGPKGSVLFFHPNIVHGSAPNISPFDRMVLILTYNSVKNTPPPQTNPRPAFVVGRDTRPVGALVESFL